MKRIELTQGQFTVVDDEDFDYLNQWKWFAQKADHTFYAARWERNHELSGSKKRSTILMHRVILEITDPKILGDHINSNGLDNKRGNLRIATDRQNKTNRKVKENKKSGTKYLGVHRTTSGSRAYWVARISVKGKVVVEACPTETAAAIKYNELAQLHHGVFARLNIVE